MSAHIPSPFLLFEQDSSHVFPDPDDITHSSVSTGYTLPPPPTDQDCAFGWTVCCIDSRQQMFHYHSFAGNEGAVRVAEYGAVHSSNLFGNVPPRLGLQTSKRSYAEVEEEEDIFGGLVTKLTWRGVGGSSGTSINGRCAELTSESNSDFVISHVPALFVPSQMCSTSS